MCSSRPIGLVWTSEFRYCGCDRIVHICTSLSKQDHYLVLKSTISNKITEAVLRFLGLLHITIHFIVMADTSVMSPIHRFVSKQIQANLDPKSCFISNYLMRMTNRH